MLVSNTQAAITVVLCTYHGRVSGVDADLVFDFQGNNKDTIRTSPLPQVCHALLYSYVDAVRWRAALDLYCCHSPICGWGSGLAAVCWTDYCNYWTGRITRITGRHYADLVANLQLASPVHLRTVSLRGWYQNDWLRLRRAGLLY